MTRFGLGAADLHAMPDAWYVQYPDRLDGPFSFERLRELARDGELLPGDRISTDRDNWLPAAQLPGLEFTAAAARRTAAGSATQVMGELNQASPSLESMLAFTAPGYELQGVLGSGAMGVVYRARQIALDRIVALKTVAVGRQNSASALARFEHEAQAVAKLRHPNIVTAFDFGRHAGGVYLAMELLEGESLEARLAREERCPPHLTWGVVRQAAAGLAHAAAHGVVHRDVKPGNLFLVPPPTGYPLPTGVPMVKVTDFGLALLHADGAATSRLTAAGVVVGTPMYMAPEQFTQSDADLRADIYALGITAYEMLSGRPPFEGITVWELMRRKLDSELPAAPGVSDSSLALLRAMTAREPAGRLGSYEELLARIDGLLSGAHQFASIVPVGGRSASDESAADLLRPLTGGPGQPRRRRLVSVVLLLMALAGAIAYAAHYFRPAPLDEPALVATGRTVPLFNGQSMAGWQILRQQWAPAQDAERASVIAGRGAVLRPLPPYEHYRVSVGADLHRASAVELHFAVPPYPSGAPTPGPPRYVLRVARDEGARVGRRASDDASFEPLSPAAPFPRPEELADQVPYLELRVERQVRGWRVYFAGKRLGELPDPGPTLREFRLVAEGGTALFDAVEVLELGPPPAS